MGHAILGDLLQFNMEIGLLWYYTGSFKHIHLLFHLFSVLLLMRQQEDQCLILLLVMITIRVSFFFDKLDAYATYTE